MKPIYKTRFSIDPGIGLESILSVSEKWLRERVKGNLRGFRQGVSRQVAGGKLVESIRTSSDSEDYFTFRFTQTDKLNKSLLWSTEFGVRGLKEGLKQVEIVMGNEWKPGSVVKPVNVELTRPLLVPLLLDNFPCRADYSLSTKPKDITQGNVKEFANSIFDRKRVLPIVYVSLANFNYKPRVDVEHIASQLAGIAHVCKAADIYHPYKLVDLIGKSMGCYDGSVRVYWPIGGARVNPSEHRSWTKMDIESNDIAKEILRTITEFTLGVPSVVTFADVRRVALRNQINAMRKKGDLSELADLYADENDTLRAELATLREQDSVYMAQITALNQRIDSLKYALENRTGKDEDRGTSKPIGSVREALERFQEMYPANISGVEIHGRAIKGAGHSLYEDPEQIFKVLEWLATAYLQSRREGNNENLRVSCKQQTGMDYTPHQSEITMRMWKNEYFLTLGEDGNGNNINLPLEEHIGKGTSRDPRETIRVAFHYDPKEKKITVGYIGQHQKNRGT